MSTSASQHSYSRYKKYSTDLARYYRMPLVQTSLSVVLSIFVTAFFIFIAIRPTLVAISKLHASIDESEKTLNQLETKAAALTTIAQTWDNIAPLQPYIDNSVPVEGPKYQSFIRSIEVLAIENNVKLTSESLGEALTYSKIINPYTGNKRTIVQIPLTMRISGAFPDVSAFFDKLTSLDRVVSIESISFAKESEAGATEEGISFSLNGNISYLADESQLNKVLTTDKKEVE